MRNIAMICLGLLALGCGEDDSATSGACENCAPADAGEGGDPGDAGATDAADQDAAIDAATEASPDAGQDAALGCLTHASGVVVADTKDLDGYPPYTVDACAMAYVSSAGELVLRDLLTGAEQMVAPAAESPRRPVLTGPVLAWEADVAGKSVIRVRASGSSTTISGGFDHAREPRATSDAVVFTGFLAPGDASDSDVFLYDTADKSVTPLQVAKGQQRFADVSASHVAWSDFSEDPSGTYSGDGTSLADIVLYDRSTKKLVSVPLPGKQAFPMLAVGGRIGFLDWLAVHPVPKLQEYRILSLPLSNLNQPVIEVASVQSDVAVRPSASATRVEWVVRWSGKSTLHRALLDGSQASIAVELGTVAEVHAPVGTTTLSVVATRSSPGAAPTLQALSVP